MGTVAKENPLYEQWLEAIESEGLNLTTWELKFIEDMRDRFDRRQTALTPSQAEQLERIYSERTP